MQHFIHKIIPKYAIGTLMKLLFFQFFVYLGTRPITNELVHYSPALPLDSKIPLMPWFIIIYLGCYLYWVINYIICAHIGQSHFKRFAKAVALGYLACGILFLVYPTTITRPSIDNLNGVAGFLMNLVYSADTPDNLFPSMHCLISWYCWITVRRQSHISIAYRIFSFVLTILVCISTVAVKQHFIVDIIAGVTIAELSWILTGIQLRNSKWALK